MMRLRFLLLVGMLAGATFFPQSSRAAAEVETVLSWTDQDFSEGLAFSNRGDLYVGFGFSGEIVQVSKTGEASLFANVDPTDNSITLGLAVDAKNNVYAAVWGFDDSTV